MASFLNNELFDAFADDLLAERSMRPLVIIGAARVDDLLLEILRAFLLPKKATNQDELLEGETPLSTFSARIKICRRVGIVDETLCTAVDRLRILRNLSAHSVSFDCLKSPIREHVAELRKSINGRRSYQWTKQRYFDGSELQSIEEMQCLLLTLCVLLEAIRDKMTPTRGNKKALRISTK